MKRFRVIGKVSLIVDCDGVNATKKSAEYIASNIALCILKSGSSKSIGGFAVHDEGNPEILEVQELPK